MGEGDKIAPIRPDLHEYVEALSDRILKSDGGGGNSGDMEARVAKLEAHMEHVRAELAKLAPMPADLATVKERQQHLPTKDEVRATIDAATDRLATKVQRQVTITGAIITVVIAGITLASRFLG